MDLDLRRKVRAMKTWESPRSQLVSETVSINKIAQKVPAKQTEQEPENKMLGNANIYGKIIKEE